MRYWAGECAFANMTFEIMPHRLRVYRPKDPCSGQYQPQLDFSRGFPAPWLYAFTDISVPSQHTMEGTHFAAEVTLSHSYSERKEGKYVRHSPSVHPSFFIPFWRGPMTHSLPLLLFCLFCLFVICWRERQVGNLSILLQEGTERDRYDFLDLHI
jgi:hypothetical protein